jgi:beta-glucosidase
VPIHHDFRTGGGRAAFYGDYTDSSRKPLFAFGHGLSYTAFAYELAGATSGATAEPVRITVRVTNTGERVGAEVVQLYVRDEVSSVARPFQQLVGFERVEIEAGATRQVEFVVHPSRLAFYDQQMRFVVEPGEFTFSVGGASDDIRVRIPVTLTGEPEEYRQREIVATEVLV